MESHEREKTFISQTSLRQLLEDHEKKILRGYRLVDCVLVNCRLEGCKLESCEVIGDVKVDGGSF